MTDNPCVLLVDDEASPGLLPQDTEQLLLSPNDGEFGGKLATLVGRADLILIDHNLELPGELSLEASDGASLVGVLRSWARTKRVRLPPLAIYTSHYEAFADEIPAVGPAVPLGGTFIGREGRIAPTLDVEWLIAKGADNTLPQISSLAGASSALRTIARDDKASLDEVKRFVAPPAQLAWTSLATEHIGRARPPVGEPETVHGEGTRGATPILRWLLHRALSYPGLFVSDLYAAWALGVEHESLREIVKRAGDFAWAQELAAGIYCGPARELFPRRWWAAGVDFASWQLRQESEICGSFSDALKSLAGANLTALQGAEKVVVVDMDLNETGLADI